MAEHKCTEPVTPKTPRVHERKSEQETNKNEGNLASRKVLTRDLNKFKTLSINSKQI